MTGRWLPLMLAAVLAAPVALMALPGAEALLPPETKFEGMEPVCDLDGDGVDDFLVNQMQSQAVGDYTGGATRVYAKNGTDATSLWSHDTVRYAPLVLPQGYTNVRSGQPLPHGPPNAQSMPDVTGDGVCDVLTFGLTVDRVRSVGTPLLGSPSVTFLMIHVEVLDGATGSVAWETTIEATDIDVSEAFFGTTENHVILNFPTALQAFDAPGGPRFVLKTTDIVYNRVDDWMGVTAPLYGFDESLYYAQASASDHIILGDASDGAIHWQRDFESDVQAEHTNVTLLSGIEDLDGDGQPDIVLDQLVVANPRGREVDNPLSNERLYQNGRGMRALALSGDANGTGQTLWSAEVLETLPIQPRPQGETMQELLAWTSAYLVDDLDGDGVPEVMASYHAVEQADAVSRDGVRRTHFVPLSGATGERMWDLRVQGWGFATSLGQGANGTMLAVGTLDLPEPPVDGAPYPPKQQRILVVEGATGHAQWTLEAPYSQDSEASYHIGLAQFHDALAPLDVDGDGLRDVVTAAMPVGPKGREQVFLATARQTVEVRSGADGSVVSAYEGFGSNGQLVPCTDGHHLFLLGGHSKRLDLMAFDAATGQEAWREVAHSMEVRRASVAGVDLVSMRSSCQAEEGRLIFGLNMEAFSFWRQFEVIPIMGALEDGRWAWLQPAPENQPPVPGMLESVALTDDRALGDADVWWTTGVASIIAGTLGLLLAGPVHRAWRRRKAEWDPLAAMMAILIVPAGLGATDADTGDPDGDLAQATHGAMPDGADAAADAVDAADAADSAGNRDSPHDGEARDATPARSPSDGSTPAAAQKDPTSGQGSGRRLPVDTPWSGAIEALGDARLTTEQKVLAVQDALARHGLPAPDLEPGFDPNDTMQFVHRVGDVDQDGVQDILIDLWCVRDERCQERFVGILDPVDFLRQTVNRVRCGFFHVAVLASGATGEPIWDRRLDDPHPLGNPEGNACATEVVVGTLPLGGRHHGALVYRYELFEPAFLYHREIHHELYFINATSNSVIWRYELDGQHTDSLCCLNENELSRDGFLTPMIRAPTGDLPDVEGITEPAILIQAVGFRAQTVDTIFSAPGFNGAVNFVDSYQPVEWAARLDVATGEELWRADTFLPEGRRSVMPMFPHEPPFRTIDWPYRMPGTVSDDAWTTSRCCGDITGDGVADLVFTTREWNQLPSSNVEGPHLLSSRIVAFDGASGERLWEEWLAQDLQNAMRRPYTQQVADGLRHQVIPVGDLDGDGTSDVLLAQEWMQPDYEHVLIAFDGATGDEMWRLSTPRAQDVLVLGDTDGDGGNDMLTFEWFEHEARGSIPSRIYGDYTNLTATPLYVRDGATGRIIAQTESISAPADLVHLYANNRRAGLPDLDDDGVGDFPVEDPVYLPDGITLHEITYLSGATLEPLVTVQAAGAFAQPTRIADLDGDGQEDIAMLSGDPNDIWVSYHSGATGEPMLHHRAVDLRLSSYAWAVPSLQFFTLETPEDPMVLMMLHMRITMVTGEYTTYTIGGDGTTSSRTALTLGYTMMPALRAVSLDGAQSWAYPDTGANATAGPGGTPGTEMVLELRSKVDPGSSEQARRIVRDLTPAFVAAPAAFVAALGAGLGWRRWRA